MSLPRVSELPDPYAQLESATTLARRTVALQEAVKYVTGWKNNLPRAETVTGIAGVFESYLQDG